MNAFNSKPKNELADKAGLDESALITVSQEPLALEEMREMEKQLERAAMINSELNKKNEETPKDYVEDNGLDDIIPIIPLVIPAAGAALIFLLAFIAVYLA